MYSVMVSNEMLDELEHSDLNEYSSFWYIIFSVT